MDGDPVTGRRHAPFARLPTRAGLTLVEVLLAVVLLGTGTTILLVSVQRGLAVARRAVQLENARRLFAALDLDEEFDERPAEPSVSEGTFEAPFSAYRWEREIRPFGDPDLPLFEIHTRIIWGDRARESMETFVTLRFIEDENGGAYDGPPPGADRAAREGMPPRAAPRTTGDRP